MIYDSFNFMVPPDIIAVLCNKVYIAQYKDNAIKINI